VASLAKDCGARSAATVLALSVIVGFSGAARGAEVSAGPVSPGSPPGSHAPVPGPTPDTAWLAKIVYPTRAHVDPDPRSRGLAEVAPVSSWGGVNQLLVLGSRTDHRGREWLRVRLDYRPNGLAAWIEADDATLSATHWRVRVTRARRRLQVYWRGRVRRSFRVVVGKPSTPTPGGLFAVAAELRQPDAQGFLGAWVLPLTAHSDVLERFDGGDGQVALHGRGGASLLDPLGSARSHGCVRLDNAAIAWVATHVPLGTPVRVD
jgi:hypothetical protein